MRDEPTNVIDLSSPTANMFGIQPCPKCKSVYRYPTTINGRKTIRCDDCHFDEEYS